jgi:predicted Zn-dependent peptidase
VTSAILGLKKGSRLHRALVREQQVAAEATAFTYDLAKGSDLLVVDVTARPDVSTEALEDAVHVELDRLHTDGVTAEEVARAVALIETDIIAALQSAGDRADRLSMFATYFGDAEIVNAQAERYRAVTPERVNAFVRERLSRDNRASLIYVPKELAEVPPQDDLAMAEVP